MWVNMGLQLMLVITILTIPLCDARSRSGIHLHDVNVGCEPTKCPKLCTRGYHYYYEGADRCLKCKCGRPKGLEDCLEETNPSLCNSVDISKDCQTNTTVRQSCNFSCSQSGQLWWAALEGNLTEVSIAITAGANPMCEKIFTHYYFGYDNAYNVKMTALHLAAWFNHPAVVVELLNNGVDVNMQTTDEGATPTYYATFNSSTDALRVLTEHNADLNIATFDQKWTPLLTAAAYGKLNEAKILIDANASLDITGGWRNSTALFIAVRRDHPDTALLLIEHNADVNIPALSDPKGKTPLMSASRRGLLNVVKALIKANASLDATGGRLKATALYYAIDWNNQEIALLLIEHNANINIPASNGMTPLMYSAQRGHLSVARALIEANASLDVTGGGDNATALYYAIRGNKPDIALLLIAHNADVSIPTMTGMTPLMEAAHRGQLSVAKALINANASITATGGWANATALYYAARGNNLDILSLLIAHNADVNIPASDGMTPLMAAARRGYQYIAKALINANASLDVTGGPDNATALYYAANSRYYFLDTVLLLIEHNADVNIPASDGITPLMAAAQLGHKSVVKALINANASITATGGWANATALYYAAWGLYGLDTVLLLIEHNADVNITSNIGMTPLMTAAHWGHLSVAKALISANASLDVTGGPLNATALHYAAERSHPDIALLLIENNADVNIPSNTGKTPLMAAAHWGRLSLAKALISANASLDVTGGPDNATALHYAASSFYGTKDIALLLLQSGADAMIPNGDGYTPAESARHNDNFQLVHIIESYSKITTTTTEDIVTSFSSTGAD